MSCRTLELSWLASRFLINDLCDKSIIHAIMGQCLSFLTGSFLSSIASWGRPEEIGCQYENETLRERAESGDACDNYLSNLPVDFRNKLMILLMPKALYRLQATSKANLKAFAFNKEVNEKMYQRLMFGNDANCQRLHPRSRSSSSDLLQEVRSQLPIIMDEDDATGKSLVHIYNTYLNWAHTRFQVQMEVLELDSETWVRKFSIHAQNNLRIFVTYKYPGKGSLYLHHTKTGKWCARNVTPEAMFMSTSTTFIIFERIGEDYVIEVWNVQNPEMEHFSHQSFPESVEPPFHEHHFPNPWYRVDDIKTIAPADQDDPCSWLRFHRRIDMPFPSHVASTFAPMHLPSHIFVTTRSDTQITARTVELSTFEPLETVKVFDSASSCLHMSEKWALLTRSLSDCYIFEFWNKFDNSVTERQLPHTYYQNDMPDFQEWNEACFDSISDVLLLVNSRCLFLVPDFEEDIISGRMSLMDCVQYIDICPSMYSQIGFHRAAFHDGRAAIVLAHHFHNGMRDTGDHVLHSLIIIDMRNWRDELACSHAYQINMVVKATSPICGISIDWEYIYCYTGTRFFTNENAELVNLCGIYNDIHLRSLHPGGIFWKTFHGMVFLAYQHPEVRHHPTHEEKIKIEKFTLQNDNLTSGKWGGIVSFAFGSIQSAVK